MECACSERTNAPPATFIRPPQSAQIARRQMTSDVKLSPTR